MVGSKAGRTTAVKGIRLKPAAVPACWGLSGRLDWDTTSTTSDCSLVSRCFACLLAFKQSSTAGCNRKVTGMLTPTNHHSSSLPTERNPAGPCESKPNSRHLLANVLARFKGFKTRMWSIHSTSKAPTQLSTLLALPVEIRNLIYHFAVDDVSLTVSVIKHRKTRRSDCRVHPMRGSRVCGTSVSAPDGPEIKSFYAGFHPRTLVSLLSLCRQTRQEMQSFRALAAKRLVCEPQGIGILTFFQQFLASTERPASPLYAVGTMLRSSITAIHIELSDSMCTESKDLNHRSFMVECHYWLRASKELRDFVRWNENVQRVVLFRRRVPGDEVEPSEEGLLSLVYLREDLCGWGG